MKSIAETLRHNMLNEWVHLSVPKKSLGGMIEPQERLVQENTSI